MSNDQQDALKDMIEKDLPRDIARIRSLSGVDSEKLKTEIAGTVLFHMRALAQSLHEFREWAYQSILQLNDGLNDVENKVDVMGGGETQFTPEDAEKFSKLIAGAEWMATELLKHGQNAEGTKKLQEFVALAKECAQIVDDGVLQDDDDEDDEDDGEEGEVEAEGSH